MNDIEAIKLLIKMKELGITDEQVKLIKEKNAPVVQETQDADKLLSQLFPNDYTDDEIMYWSTPYYDELQAQKELRKQKAEDNV